MASKMEKSVEDLEREITCAICQCHFTEPKVLPCCHYYCKECIRSLANRAGIHEPFACPECRTKTTLPEEGGVDGLPTAFFVNRIKEVLSRLSLAYGKVEAACEMCSGPTAEAFCRQCAMFVCAECVKQHRRMKIFAGHKVTSISDLKVGRSKEIVILKPPLQVCEAHDQPMNIYCFDCSCMICRDCTIKIHNGHNHEFLKVAAPEMKKGLVAKLKPLKKTQTDLSHAVEEIRTISSAVKTHGHDVSSQIESLFSELFRTLASQKKELLNATAKQMSQKMADLSSQEKKLSTASVVVQSVTEYTEQCIEHLADDEVMRTHLEIHAQIDSEIEKHVKSIKPVFENAIEVEVKRRPKPRRKRPTFVRTVMSGLGKPFDIAVNSTGDLIITERRSLILLDKNGKRFKNIPASCYGVDLFRGVAIDDVTGNVFVTSTQKIMKLNHDMELIRDADISDCIGQTEDVVPGITVLKNRVFVCGKKCQVYNKHLEFIKQFSPGSTNKEDEETSHFYSVCSDQDGKLYFTNCGNSSVSSYTYDGRFMHTFNQVTPVHPLTIVQSSSFTPCGICVSGGYVYVTNQKTHAITIFTTGGEYIASFGREGSDDGRFDHPQGICVDKDGYLYICDKERIQMFATR